MFRRKEKEIAKDYQRRTGSQGATFENQVRRMLRENKAAAVSLAVIVILFILAAISPLIAGYGETKMDLLHRLEAPSGAHLLGTDEGGRDVLSRLLYGSRISLLVGVVPTLLSMTLGAALGVLAGYKGGIMDAVIMRLADVVLAFPSILLAMVIMYTLGDGLINVFLTLTLLNWGSVARVVRAETMKLKNSEYVTAARCIGTPRGRIMRKHILPNCMPTLIVLFTLNVPGAILTESSLSFLGLGIQPPSASWGLMVNAGRQYLANAPWLCFAPCGAILITVLAFNFLGDGLRDAMDPRQKKR